MRSSDKDGVFTITKLPDYLSMLGKQCKDPAYIQSDIDELKRAVPNITKYSSILLNECKEFGFLRESIEAQRIINTVPSKNGKEIDGDPAYIMKYAYQTSG